MKRDLQNRRAFYIRYTNVSIEELKKLTTNELELRERNIYHEKYNSQDKSEYTPSTL